MGPEVRHLRYFVAVADAGGFSAAARRVHVAQQVLSAQVRQLEQLVGARLLERHSRGVTLTAAGAAFLADARDSLAALDRAVATARRRASDDLTVGLSVAASGEVPTHAMADFRRAHPDVDVRLRTYDLAHPSGGLASGEVDVAFVRPPVDAAGIVLAQLAEEPRVVVLPVGHHLAGTGPVDLSQLLDEPWVAAVEAVDGCTPTAWRDDWLAMPRPDGRSAQVGAVAATIDEWREHVAAGRGVSICPASAERYYARPDLAFAPATGVSPARLCLAWRDSDDREVVRSFVRVVVGA